MCLHTTGPAFPEEMGETQSEYSDSSCGESLSLPPFAREKEGPCRGSMGLCFHFVQAVATDWEKLLLQARWHLRSLADCPTLDQIGNQADQSRDTALELIWINRE